MNPDSRLISQSYLQGVSHDKVTLTVIDGFYRHTKTEFIFLFNKSKSEAELTLLKVSLERTLAIYFPYTGRLVENLQGVAEITWNGIQKGILYEEFEDDLLLSFDDEYLQSSLVRRYYPGKTESLMAIRVTNFPKSSGLVIALCLHHAVGDGATAFNFLTHWWKLASLFAEGKQVEDISGSEFTEVFTDRRLLDTDVKVMTQPDAVTYLSTSRVAFFANIKNQEFSQSDNHRMCSFFLGSKTVLSYQQRAREIGVKITENDIICSMIFRSFVLASPSLFEDEDRIVHCGFPINLRGRRKAKEIPRGFMGNALVLARISGRVGDILKDDNLTYLSQLFRSESIQWYDSSNIESYLSFFQNCDNKEKVYFSFETNFVISSWNSFPMYTTKLFGEVPQLSGPMFPFTAFENTKFCPSREGDGVYIYSQVLSSKYDQLHKYFQLMSGQYT